MALIDDRRLGRIIAYDAGMVDILGSIEAAILFRHLRYCSSPNASGYCQAQPDEDGWFEYGLDPLARDLGFGDSQISGAKKRLLVLGVLQQRKIGIPARNFYRFSDEAIENLFGCRDEKPNKIQSGENRPTGEVKTTEHSSYKDSKKNILRLGTEKQETLFQNNTVEQNQTKPETENEGSKKHPPQQQNQKQLKIDLESILNGSLDQQPPPPSKTALGPFWSEIRQTLEQAWAAHWGIQQRGRSKERDEALYQALSGGISLSAFAMALLGQGASPWHRRERQNGWKLAIRDHNFGRFVSIWQELQKRKLDKPFGLWPCEIEVQECGCPYPKDAPLFGKNEEENWRGGYVYCPTNKKWVRPNQVIL